MIMQDEQDEEVQRWQEAGLIVDTLKGMNLTLKETLRVLTEQPDLRVRRYPTSVVYMYGKEDWECIIVCPLLDGAKLWDWHNYSFNIIL